MENITFYKQINLFLENKMPRKPSACIRRSAACIHKHRPTHTVRVLETIKDKFFCINVEVWNESYIIWELFQTPIFSLYKVIHGTFSNTHRKP